MYIYVYIIHVRDITSYMYFVISLQTEGGQIQSIIPLNRVAGAGRVMQRHMPALTPPPAEDMRPFSSTVAMSQHEDPTQQFQEMHSREEIRQPNVHMSTKYQLQPQQQRPTSHLADPYQRKQF